MELFHCSSDCNNMHVEYLCLLTQVQFLVPTGDLVSTKNSLREKKQHALLQGRHMVGSGSDGKMKKKGSTMKEYYIYNI